MKHIALVLALLMIAGSAQAYPRYVIKTDCDEPAYGDDTIVDIACEGTNLAVGPDVDDVSHETYAMITNTDASGNDNMVALYGYCDLLTATPGITDGSEILNVTLRWVQRGASEQLIEINRITSPWLVEEGVEYTVTGIHRVTGGGDPYWMEDLGKTPGTDTEGNPTYDDFVGFSASDYTATNAVQFNYGPYNYNSVNLLDVTELVRDIYESGDNQGLVFRLISPYAADPWGQGDEQTQTGDDGYDAKPTLYITYVPEPATIGLLAIGGVAALLRRKR
jgi:hypothetical protein